MPKSRESKFFPGKLRIMLDQVDGLGLGNGASWVSEGHAFAIHDQDVFMNEIAPQFFDKQTHLRSFHRQLSIWGFTRLETGAGGRGVWFHKHFIRDKPELLQNIKRVPVKNPKPSMATPKNRLPDYTNYQLPVSVSCHQEYVHSTATAKGSHAHTMKPMAVHQPHHNIAAAATAATTKGGLSNGLPDSRFLPACANSPMRMPPPSETLGYLSGVTPRYVSFGHNHNTEFPMPINSNSVPSIASDETRRYPPFMLANYQPSMVPSMSPLQNFPAGIPNIPSFYNLDEMAQQLIAYRNNNSCQMPLKDGNNNLDVATLAMVMDSRRQGNLSTSNGVGLNSQDLLSAIALRNLLPQAQGPASS